MLKELSIFQQRRVRDPTKPEKEKVGQQIYQSHQHHLLGGAEQEPVKSAMLLKTRWRRHK